MAPHHNPYVPYILCLAGVSSMGNGRGLQTPSHINNRPLALAATGSKSSICEPLLYGNTSRHLRPTSEKARLEFNIMFIVAPDT
ncbi:hypothetical protein KY290_012167 [Solanum tuberosum]|uniref:Uncharacterized protein n=1 Tax=Solanum tuberosum TaxID=4113 RepID=A0ABQ7W2S6_SOLTU|nr:hypothetical protein KY284_012242 [Solanum tuberosum]KAH0775030.1 hypothetical protein KY290_012167 [Solanum tuberosum]